MATGKMRTRHRRSLSLKTRFWAWWEGDDPWELERRSGLEANAAGGAQGGKGPADDPFAASVAALALTLARPNAAQAPELNRFGTPLWSEGRIQVAETIWGDGFITPGGDAQILDMVKPLALNPSMEVLDMSAGLGGSTRVMARQFGVKITGLEASAALAGAAMARSVDASLGMKAPVNHFAPEKFRWSNKVDTVFAKESFVFVHNKERLIDNIGTYLKPRGQFLFTDYIVDPEPRDPMSLKAWAAREPVEPRPWTLDAMVVFLKKRGFDLRATEDVTVTHRTQILTAVLALAESLEERNDLEQSAKAAVVDEVDLWAHRMRALESGLRCYRFYATRAAA